MTMQDRMNAKGDVIVVGTVLFSSGVRDMI